MRRVAVIGSEGQLGSDLVKVLMKDDYKVYPLSHKNLECKDPESVRGLLSIRPDIVVNCTGFVQVDESESRPQEAFEVNAVGALNVARACLEMNALAVYISTDYVFSGEKGKPYTEADIPRPLNVYGASKLVGEYLVQQTCSRWMIVRMASLYGKVGARGKGGNFIKSILSKVRAGESLRIVHDIRMSPTYTVDAAWALESLFRDGTTGIFHVTNQGNCTWFEFARQTLELVGFKDCIEPISSDQYLAKAHRPSDSSLVSSRIGEEVRKRLRPWQEALRAYLFEEGVNLEGMKRR